MPRKRDIKPDFNDNDDIASLSCWARLLYICMWGHLDRQGLIEDSPRGLRSKVFPREDHPVQDVEAWRDELLRPGPSGRPRLIRFQWKGRPLLYCPGLREHNSIYSDEPGRFHVPEETLQQLCEKHGIEMIICQPASGKKRPKGSGGAPDIKSPGPGNDPAGSREDAGQDPAGSRPSSSTSPSPSPSPSASTLASASPSASPGGAAPVPGKLRVVDNSPPGDETGSGTGESCARCEGTGKLQARIKAVPNAPAAPFRCECPLGELAGLKSWSRWSSDHAQHYEIVAEPRAG